MDGPAESSGLAVESEPRGMSVADLVLLVAGFALLMILPWFGF